MASLGPISASVLNSGGSRFAATNTFKVNGGNGNALGTVDTVTGLSGAITAVNQGAKKFTVAGNQTSKLPPTGTLTVSSSTGNDGTYTIVSATFGTATEIVVAEAIPDATVNGTITTAYGPVATYHLTNTGSGYASATAVTTTTLTGLGSGLTIDTTANGTTVTGTVTDTDGTAWAGAAWSADYFSETPGQPSVGGLSFTQSFTGTLNGSGVLSVSLTPSDTIFPAGSKWRFRITSLVTGQIFSVDITITGASQSITTQLSNAILAPRITGLAIPTAYADAEISPSAGMYLRISDGVIRYWTGSAWASVSGSSVLQSATVTLTAAQCKTLQSIPVNLVAAPGAGKVLVPLWAVFQYTFVTTAYVTVSKLYILGPYSFDGTTPAANQELSGSAALLPNASSGISQALFMTNELALENTALQLQSDADDSGGDGTLKVTVYYTVVTL